VDGSTGTLGAAADGVDAKASSKDEGPCESPRVVGVSLLGGEVKMLSKPLVCFTTDNATGVSPFKFVGGAGGNFADGKTKLSSNAVSKLSCWGTAVDDPLGIFPIASSKAFTPAACTSSSCVEVGKGVVEAWVTGTPKASLDCFVKGESLSTETGEAVKAVKADVSINGPKVSSKGIVGGASKAEITDFPLVAGAALSS